MIMKSALIVILAVASPIVVAAEPTNFRRRMRVFSDEETVVALKFDADESMSVATEMSPIIDESQVPAPTPVPSPTTPFPTEPDIIKPKSGGSNGSKKGMFDTSPQSLKGVSVESLAEDSLEDESMSYIMSYAMNLDAFGSSSSSKSGKSGGSKSSKGSSGQARLASQSPFMDDLALAMEGLDVDSVLDMLPKALKNSGIDEQMVEALIQVLRDQVVLG